MKIDITSDRVSILIYIITDTLFSIAEICLSVFVVVNKVYHYSQFFFLFLIVIYVLYLSLAN